MKNLSRYFNLGVMTPLALFVIGVFYFANAVLLGPPIEKGLLNESFFPLILGAMLTVFSALLLYPAVKKAGAAAETEKGANTEKMKKPFIIALLTLGYVVAFAYVGFLISSPIYVFLFLVFFDDKPRNFLRKFIYALIITAIIYGLYEVLFEIHFPEIWS